MRLRTLVLVILGAIDIGAASAQQPLAVGVEGGAAYVYHEPIGQIGIRAAPWRGGFSTVDFAFATYPKELADGVLLFLMDLGVTHGVPADSSPVFFLPHAGVTMVTSGHVSGAGSGGGGAAVGYHVGAGLLVHLTRHFGIRADYTYRHLLNFESTWSSITGTLLYMR